MRTLGGSMMFGLVLSVSLLAQESRPLPVPSFAGPDPGRPPLVYVESEVRIPNYPAGKPWGVQGKPFHRMQRPLSPEGSLKHLVLPVGFEARLFVSEPQLGGKPIAMNWDARGRLWVAESVDYPNQLAPDGKGRDRIRICEDRDEDGRADHFTVFARNLSIPTAIAFWRGGVLVQNGRETLFLKDTDGDDVADERRVVFSGWGMHDTHGGVSHFRYGLDNWIWAMQGYNPSRPTVAGNPYREFRQGFFRFRPDGSALEFLRSTNNNTWGLGWTEDGIVFGSTANRNPSVHLAIPNRYYERVRGWTPPLVLGTIATSHLFKAVTRHVRQVDHHGGYTAAAGHAIYTARAYPKAYWNQAAFVCGPTGHLVGVFHLRPSGSSFRAEYRFNLVASYDEWTAPISAEVGPDGYVWVIDWYNYIVQHNPTPHGFQTGRGNAYVTKLRDKTRGRIWRIVYTGPGGRMAPPPDLHRGGAKTLVAALRHPVMLWRLHAQRLLVERGKPDVVPSLVALIRDRRVDEIGLNVGAIHALWTLQGLGMLDGRDEATSRVVYEALRHPSAGVRRNALAVLPPVTASTRQVLAAGCLRDAHAQVRLAALLALADLPPVPEGAPAIAEVLDGVHGPVDRWLFEAAVCAAARQEAAFLVAASSKGKVGAVGVSDALGRATRIVAEHVARGPESGRAVDVVQKMAEARRDIAEAFVEGLLAGWPADRRVAVESGLSRQAVDAVRKRLSPHVQSQWLALMQRWGYAVDEGTKEAVRRALWRVVDASDGPADEVGRAARELVRLAKNESTEVRRILDRITLQLPPARARALFAALAHADSRALAPAVLARLPHWTPQLREWGLGLLLVRRNGVRAVLEAMEQGRLSPGDLSLSMRRNLLQHPDRAVREAARKALDRSGLLPSRDRAPVYKKLLPLAERRGDPSAGKQVFRKHCAKCHKHSGEGKNVGPDLTGMRTHPKAELLLQIVDPSRTLEANYRVYQVAMRDGKIFSGLLAAESASSVELVDAEGRRHRLLRSDIEAIRASDTSLMPEGFEKQLTEEDWVNLLEFLVHPDG